MPSGRFQVDRDQILGLIGKLAEIMSENDILYVESVLDMDIKDLNKEEDNKLVAFFLLLLEVFIGNYIHPLMMLYEINRIFSKLKEYGAIEKSVKPILVFDNYKEIDCEQFVEEYQLRSIYSLYKELFLEEKYFIKRLIEEVDDEKLRRRFKRFFGLKE